MKRKSEISGAITRSAAVAVLLSTAILSITSGFNSPRCSSASWRLALSESAANPAKQSVALSFADRVAYQRAIEEVYWRHRIWPKERPDPKPFLDEVMSAHQIENKVEDYLRDSQALEEQWQAPITPEQLQAEMDRMAHHTKQPQVLREIFQALDDDPFVIAECLAKPVLAQRLVAELKNEDRVKLTKVAWVEQPFESLVARAGTQMPVIMALSSANYTLPVISSPSGGCIDDTWNPTSLINAPAARSSHTAVWTGSEMIVWGGSALGSTYFNTGGRYNPSTDSWTATTTTNAPVARNSHTAVWTGSEMIIWGGYNGSPLNSGGRYNPTADSWTATSTTNAPSARYGHTAVWTGSEMIVWGGAVSPGTYSNTGGTYNPAMDSWAATTTTNAPTARGGHTSVWTGNEMIVWGGAAGSNRFNTGGKYNPGADSWTATSTTNAPSPRFLHTAVWTNGQMIVWAGNEFAAIDLNTGGRYTPDADSWTATSTTNAPSARNSHTAVWIGSEMIVWGGAAVSPLTYFNTGGKYSPDTDSWTATSIANAPAGRDVHTAVWTGSEMIVWGGYNGSSVLNSGGRYCAQSGATPTPTPTATSTATATATATATPTLTPTPTATASATPRPAPTPRVRGTPAPRP